MSTRVDLQIFNLQRYGRLRHRTTNISPIVCVRTYWVAYRSRRFWWCSLFWDRHRRTLLMVLHLQKLSNDLMIQVECRTRNSQLSLLMDTIRERLENWMRRGDRLGSATAMAGELPDRLCGLTLPSRYPTRLDSPISGSPTSIPGHTISVPYPDSIHGHFFTILGLFNPTWYPLSDCLLLKNESD